MVNNLSKKVLLVLLLFYLIFSTYCKKNDIFNKLITSPSIYPISQVTISPNGSVFAVDENITLSATNSATAIYYRININGGWGLWQTYSGGNITINQSIIFEAYAVNGNGNGQIISAIFSKSGEKPTVSFSPLGGVFNSSVNVSISATNSPTSVEYRINGGAWQSYSGALNISSDSLLEARAGNAFGTSQIGPATYLIEPINTGEQNPVDFTGGFTVKSGTVNITDLLDGTFRLQTGTSGIAIYNPTDGKTNYVVTGEIKLEPTFNSYGIIFRMQDTPTLRGYGFQYESVKLRLVYFYASQGWNDASMMLNNPTDLPNPTYNDPPGIVVTNTADNEWHSFVFIANGHEIKVYLDGVLRYSTNTSTSSFFTTSWWNNAHLINYGIPPTWDTGGLGLRFWSSTSILARNWQYQEIN